MQNAKQYMAAAKLAVDHVRKVMDIGPSNRLSRAYWGFPAKKLCEMEMRDRTAQELAEIRTTRLRVQEDVNWQDQLNVSASWARHFGCGNCGEYSAMAFVYLRDVLKVRPLDWIEYGGMKHAFVVVGREAGSAPTEMEETFGPAAIGKWNDSTVLCDAHYGDVLDYTHIVLTLGSQKKMRLLYRLE